jgi:hypothetical protein
VVLVCATLAVAVGPVPNADIGPFTLWRSVSNPNNCVQAVSATFGSRLVTKACDAGNALQKWAWLKDATNIYRLQNGASAVSLCAWLDDQLGGPGSGQPVHLDECTLSDGSGNTVSNAQWDTGISLPNAVQLRTHIHFRTIDWCIDIVGTDVEMEKCESGRLEQRWTIGF